MGNKYVLTWKETTKSNQLPNDRYMVSSLLDLSCNKCITLQGRDVNVMESHFIANSTVCSIVCSGWHKSKHERSTLLALYEAIPRLLVDSPYTKGQWCGKRFHAITSLFVYFNFRRSSYVDVHLQWYMTTQSCHGLVIMLPSLRPSCFLVCHMSHIKLHPRHSADSSPFHLAMRMRALPCPWAEFVGNRDIGNCLTHPSHFFIVAPNILHNLKREFPAELSIATNDSKCFQPVSVCCVPNSFIVFYDVKL